MIKRRLAFVGWALAAAFIIVVGCSAPSADGTDVKNGKPKSSSSASSSGTGSSSGNSASSSSGSGLPKGDCTNIKADNNPTCDKCARSKCCDELAACSKDAKCQAGKKCVDDCPNGDIFCVFTCAQTNPSELVDKFAECLNTNCKTECASAAPNLDGGGTSGDPFGDI